MKCTRLEGVAEVTGIGSSCIGCMAWEAPYIQFRVYADEYTEEHVDVIWHSDNIPNILYKQDKLYHNSKIINRWFDFSALVRGERVWRILNLKYR